MTSNLTYKGLSTYSQLVGFRKPDTLKNQTCRTFDMIGDIPPCAPFNKLIIFNPCSRGHATSLGNDSPCRFLECQVYYTYQLQLNLGPLFYSL